MTTPMTRWWNATSLRTKITGVTVVMLTLGILGAGAGSLMMVRNWVLAEHDETLISVASRDLDEYFANDRDGNVLHVEYAEEVFIALYRADGTFQSHNWELQDPSEWPVVPATLSVRDVETANANGFRIYSLRAENGESLYRAVSVPVQLAGDADTHPAIIAISMSQAESLLRAYLAIYISLGLAIIVIGAIITRMIVTSTFSPLRRVERTAAAIAAGDYSQRLEGATPNTEVGRLNRSLNTMLSKIEGAFKDRARTIDNMRRFVGDASHELRTPLVSVRGYAELYRMGALKTPEDVAGAMERIEKEAIRMSGLVENLLELARLDEAKPLEVELTDLVPIACDAALDASVANPSRTFTVIAPALPVPAAGAAGGLGAGSSGSDGSEAPSSTSSPSSSSSSSLTKPPLTATGPIALAGAALSRLRSRRPSDAGSHVTPSSTSHSSQSPDREFTLDAVVADPRNPAALMEHSFGSDHTSVMAEGDKLRQVLNNLIVNATRYTPESTPIEIQVTPDLAFNRVHLDVIDHGEGIPPQIREKIFERFWRADTSRARETGGSGLGLAIVAALVAAHNGSVDVFETPGGGATFRVSLPAAGSTAAPRPIVAE